MRSKRRNTPPASLFDPPAQMPRPDPDALEEAKDLLKLLLHHLAAPREAGEAEPSSSLEHKGQNGGGQASERQADASEGHSFD